MHPWRDGFACRLQSLTSIVVLLDCCTYTYVIGNCLTANQNQLLLPCFEGFRDAAYFSRAGLAAADAEWYLVVSLLSQRLSEVDCECSVAWTRTCLLAALTKMLGCAEHNNSKSLKKGYICSSSVNKLEKYKKWELVYQTARDLWSNRAQNLPAMEQQWSSWAKRRTLFKLEYSAMISLGIR